MPEINEIISNIENLSYIVYGCFVMSGIWFFVFGVTIKYIWPLIRRVEKLEYKTDEFEKWKQCTDARVWENHEKGSE